MEVNEPTDKIYNLDERLVRFAGESILFVRKLNKTFELEYYKNQLIRSSGSSSLNYGESQGTITDKDYVFKLSLVVKELKESRNSLRILEYIKEGNEIERTWLLNEIEELIAITSKIIINKTKKYDKKRFIFNKFSITYARHRSNQINKCCFRTNRLSRKPWH